MDESRAVYCRNRRRQLNAVEFNLMTSENHFFFLLVRYVNESSTCQNFNVTCVLYVRIFHDGCWGEGGWRNSGGAVVFYAPQFISILLFWPRSGCVVVVFFSLFACCSCNCRLSAVALASSSSSSYISIAVWHIFFHLSPLSSSMPTYPLYRKNFRKNPLTHFTAKDISFLARRNFGKPYAKFNHQKKKKKEAAERKTYAHRTQTENAFLGFSTMNSNSNIRVYDFYPIGKSQNKWRRLFIPIVTHFCFTFFS